LKNIGLDKVSKYKTVLVQAMNSYEDTEYMFGSDWPVANLAGNYMDVWSETNKAIADYSEHERVAILGGTAAKFYDIQAE
jgi:L-fuconolactonase